MRSCAAAAAPCPTCAYGRTAADFCSPRGRSANACCASTAKQAFALESPSVESTYCWTDSTDGGLPETDGLRSALSWVELQANHPGWGTLVEDEPLAPRKRRLGFNESVMHRHVHVLLLVHGSRSLPRPITDVFETRPDMARLSSPRITKGREVLRGHF
jgi:hypothetical protein